EHAMRARSARVDDPFGNPLMVEMEDLLAQNEVFDQRRAALSGAQAVLIVGDSMTEIVGQMRDAIPMIGVPANVLMKFAAITDVLFGRGLSLSRLDLSEGIAKARRCGGFLF